jgi:hypothetical protein
MQPLQQMVLGKLNIHMYKTETRSLSSTLGKKINSKWMKDLRKTGKILEEKGIGKPFLIGVQLFRK